MDISDFDYDLPDALVAQEPADRRDAARLLVLNRGSGEIGHHRFAELPALLDPGDLVVVNDVRVVPARLLGRRAATGGKVEVLVLGPFYREPEPSRGFDALVRAGGRLRVGETLDLEDGSLQATVKALPGAAAGVGGVFAVDFHDAGGDLDRKRLLARLEELGRMPLPPYIQREAEADDHLVLDRTRYQTVFAQHPGAVAAPTAALHFTEAVFDGLRERGVGVARLCLHVGIGTFLPVRVDRVEDHPMHAEHFVLPDTAREAVLSTRQSGGRVIAVGTTSVRSLEWWARTGERQGATSLYVYPPFRFLVVDVLMTNFHLPRSTPLLLASAFAGRDLLLAAYREAVAAGYRFYSYGDSMLVL